MLFHSFRRKGVSSVMMKQILMCVPPENEQYHAPAPDASYVQILCYASRSFLSISS